MAIVRGVVFAAAFLALACLVGITFSGADARGSSNRSYEQNTGSVPTSTSAPWVRSLYQPAPHVHISPPPSAVRRGQPGAPGRSTIASVGDVTYHGGPVQQTFAAYTIFWSPNGAISPGYRTLINRYFQDINGSGLYNINSQYYQLPGPVFPQDVSTLGGTWVDTKSYPAGKGSAQDPLSDLDIQNEVTRALNLNPRWKPADLGRTYFVYTEPGIESCFDPAAASADLSCTAGITSPTAYCAYHSWFARATKYVLYANMPYGDTWADCTDFTTSPNGDIAADGEISTSSHEQFEAVTDPLVGANDPFGAWFDTDSSGEIGDKCSLENGPTQPDGSNILLNGNPYIVQLEWSNQDGGCVSSLGSPVETPQPTPSDTPTPTHSASQLVWGDDDCNGHVDPVDSLKVLKTDAGLPVTQTVPGCPAMGVNVTVNGMSRPWGDGDCDNHVNPVDSLKTLKTDAGIHVSQTVAGCPDFGSLVTPGSGFSLTAHATPTPTPSPISGGLATQHASWYYDYP